MSLLIAGAVVAGVAYFATKKPVTVTEETADASAKANSPKTDAACDAANAWYENSGAKKYVPPSAWYRMPCYKRIEAAANPVYFLNAEIARTVGNAIGLKGVSIKSVENKVSNTAGAVEDTVNHATDQVTNAVNSAAKALGF